MAKQRKLGCLQAKVLACIAEHREEGGSAHNTPHGTDIAPFRNGSLQHAECDRAAESLVKRGLVEYTGLYRYRIKPKMWKTAISLIPQDVKDKMTKYARWSTSKSVFEDSGNTDKEKGTSE